MAMADTEAVEPFVEFQYVRGILGTSSPAISEVLIDALAVEGAIIDLLAEAKLMDNAAILDAVKGARSESRKRQARVLLDKMVECKDWPITNFLFFLRTYQPGLLNIIEAGLLERVQKALESDWNNVADLVEQQEPPSEGGTALQEFAEARENQRPINVICVGKAGARKSTLANALLGENRVKTARGGMCVTNAVEEVRYAGLEQPFVYWDTPGITADSDAQKEFKKMARELKKKGQDVDLLILCAPASEGRDHPDNKSIVKSLTKAIGKKVWSHAVIALSQANLVVDPDNDITTAEYFHRECVTEMKFRYRKFLVEAGELSPEEAEAVPCIPVGRYVEPLLPDGTNWKKEFWIACLGRVSADVRGVLMACGITDQSRFGEVFGGVDKARMLMGMSLVGGSAGGAAVGAGVGIGIAIQIGAATGGGITAPTGPGAAIGAAAIWASVFAGIKLFDRYKAMERVRAYETLVGTGTDGRSQSQC